MKPTSTMSSVVNDRFGAIIVSVILGMGLAAIFRATCHGQSCIIVHGPPREQTDSHVYRIDDQCYRYIPYAVGCPSAPAAPASDSENPPAAVV